RADAIDLQGVDGMPQVIAGAGGTGEVQDEIDGIVDDERLRRILAQEAEPGVAGQVGQVPGRSRQQAVDPHDVPVTLPEIVTEVRAEKPGGTGDEHGGGRSAARAHARTRSGSACNEESPRPRL